MWGSIGAVIIGLKLLSAVVSGIFPLVLTERGLGNFFYFFLFSCFFLPSVDAESIVFFDMKQETAQMLVVIIGVFSVSFLQKNVARNKKVLIGCTVAAGGIAVLLLLQELQSKWLLSLLVGYTSCLYLLGVALSIWSLQMKQPLSRFKLIATVFSQLLHVVAIITTLSNAILLGLIALAVGLVLNGISKKKKSKSVTLELGGRQREDVEKGEDAEVSGVSLAAFVGFIPVLICGLNGEQILDARLKLSLRKSHLDGDKNPIILHHCITAMSRLFAFQSSASNVQQMALIWGATQLFRLMVLNSISNLRNLYLTGFLIALDKYAGSLGEIALETAVLQKIPTLSHGWIPAIVLLSMMQPFEDITGSLVKLIVRNNVLGRYQSVVVLGLVLSIVWVMLRWTRESNQKNQKKEGER
jgi:hypothetical protein